MVKPSSMTRTQDILRSIWHPDREERIRLRLESLERIRQRHAERGEVPTWFEKLEERVRGGKV